MIIASHENWKRAILGEGQVDQKTFRVVDPLGQETTPAEIDITFFDNSQAESAAEEVGFMIDVRLHNAPDQVLFTGTYPTEEQARQVMEDLSQAAAEVEGLLKQEDFENAKIKTDELMKKFDANSGEPPVEEN